MSSEEITSKNLNKTSKVNSFNSQKAKVNINDLLSRVREENNKQKKENYMFVGLAVGVAAITGIIASL